jgi:hypothetical protein
MVVENARWKMNETISVALLGLIGVLGGAAFEFLANVIKARRGTSEQTPAEKMAHMKNGGARQFITAGLFVEILESLMEKSKQECFDKITRLEAEIAVLENKIKRNNKARTRKTDK